MSTAQKIEIIRTNNLSRPADVSKLGFGNYYRPHVHVNYDEGKGWHSRIVPYGPLSSTLPRCACTTGRRCSKDEGVLPRRRSGAVPSRRNGKAQPFERAAMYPLIDEIRAQGAELLVKSKELDSDGEGTSLYIRPFIIATDPHIGVRPASHLLFIIILSPVGAYYPQGINPVNIYVERKYVRTVRGGTGYVKTAGNYAASLKAQDEAYSQGYTQVLWLDGVERKYIEEVGTMNVFFKIDGEIITQRCRAVFSAGLPACRISSCCAAGDTG